MEKLQKAIEQARETRKGNVPSSRAETRQSGEASALTPPGWDSIPIVETSPRHLTRNRVVTHSTGSASTPYEILRTRVMQQMAQNGWRRLMITSPMPACGKTTLAANLAFATARQQESSMILFEFDMRKPNLRNVIGKVPDTDVSDVISGALPFEEQAFRISEKVAISAASKSTDDPTRFINSRQTLDILDSIEERLAPDLVVFDLPPLLVNDDARSLLPSVDAVLLVARAESTTVKQIDICEREIAEQTNFLGVTLSHYRHADEAQAYEYYYS